MLLQYHQQIVTVLIGLLLWMPVAGLQAQIVDVSMVNTATDSTERHDVYRSPKQRIERMNKGSERHSKDHSKDHCSAHPMDQADNNCVTDGESCQYDNNCCEAKLLSILEYSTGVFYITDSFMAVAKSLSVPMLILPTEIKPPRTRL